VQDPRSSYSMARIDNVVDVVFRVFHAVRGRRGMPRALGLARGRITVIWRRGITRAAGAREGRAYGNLKPP
jgi:hypothetical protein